MRRFSVGKPASARSKRRRKPRPAFAPIGSNKCSSNSNRQRIPHVLLEKDCAFLTSCVLLASGTGVVMLAAIACKRIRASVRVFWLGEWHPCCELARTLPRLGERHLCCKLAWALSWLGERFPRCEFATLLFQIAGCYCVCSSSAQLI